MSKPLFEFVKVAAGEPVDVGSLVCYMQPDLRAMVRELSFGPGGKAPHDFWLLRPAEYPDAGGEDSREGDGDAVEFAEWCGEQSLQYMPRINKWQGPEQGKYTTTAILLNLYKQSKTK